VQHLISVARADGIPVLLNAAPAQVLPPALLQGLDHLVVNATEAATLLGRDEDTISEDRHGVTLAFRQMGVKNVILTLGPRGASYRTSDDYGDVEPKPIPPEKVVDTTAAGDTWIASYALDCIYNRPIKDRILRANHAASKTIQKEGAQTSIPFLSDLDIRPGD
jgi:ribokinase